MGRGRRLLTPTIQKLVEYYNELMTHCDWPTVIRLTPHAQLQILRRRCLSDFLSFELVFLSILSFSPPPVTQPPA